MNWHAKWLFRLMFGSDCFHWNKKEEQTNGNSAIECCTYGGAMVFHGLLCHCVQLLTIEGGGTWIVLLMCIGRIAIVLSKELSRICVATQLHLPQLNPCPVRVQICGSNECQMNTQIPMHSWTIDANEHTVRYRWPRRILRTAIKTCLQTKRNELMNEWNWIAYSIIASRLKLCYVTSCYVSLYWLSIG